MKHVLSALLMPLLLVPTLRAQEGGAVLLSPWTELQWRSDYNSARKEAHEKNLPLVIDFGTPDCFWCRKLDDTTFKDPRVVALMGQRFVPLKIDAEREMALANHLRIESYPTLVFATSDGKILAYLKGYQDAETFHDVLQRLLVNTQAPQWMQRNIELAWRKIQSGEYGEAVPLLRAVLDDGKSRPMSLQAQKHLDGLEQKAMQRLADARDLQAKGKIREASALLQDTVKQLPGLESTRLAEQLITRLKEEENSEKATAARLVRARELLAQARDFYKSKDIVPCLDRCSHLIRDYIELPEGQEALTIVADIKNNAALVQQAADALSERLGEMYLALAESYHKQGQPQRAEFYLQRVVLACPGSRHAEVAQVRLAQLQSLRSGPTPGLTSVRPE